jgi:hypothetical protein
MKIPQDYIEDANSYVIIPSDVTTGIPIGGRIMMNLVVREQMEISNIVATAGIEKEGCIIMVDYKYREVMQFIENAKFQLEKYGTAENKLELEALAEDDDEEIFKP